MITVVEEADGTLSENENPQSSESQSNETATSVATEPVPAISESATTVEISSNTGGYGSPVARPLSNRISELAAANSINLNKPLDQIVLQTAIPITIKPTQSGQIVIPTDGPSPTATLPPVVQPTTKPVSTSAAVNPTKVQLPAAKTPTPGTQLDGGAVLLPTSVPLTTQAMTYLPTSSLTITATRLPKTGFADEVGLPLLALGALILLALLFLIRQLQIKSLQ